jgi:Rne/Rng family ribonuclease
MPRRLLDAATVEQILVRDLFGERIARLSVDTVEAYDAIIDDLRRTGATEDTISKVELHTGQEDVFDALGQRKAVSSAEEERVWLTSPDLPGAHLVIQQTEALTAVDVNAGRAAFVSNSDTESVAQAVNVAAAKEIALQLRLRDIGGLVMIDFIDMTSREHRKTVEAAFLNAAKDDRAQLTFLPISPLGVMEIARERLQGNHSGQRVIADEKGMPIVPVGPNGGPRRMKGPRPPPWVTRGRGSRRDRSSDATAAHGNDFVIQQDVE